LKDKNVEKIENHCRSNVPGSLILSAFLHLDNSILSLKTRKFA